MSPHKITIAAAIVALMATSAHAGSGCAKYGKGAHPTMAYGHPMTYGHPMAYGYPKGYHHRGYHRPAMAGSGHGKSAKSGGYGDSKAVGKAAKRLDLVDLAISAGSFSTLVKAVQAAGLVDTLKGKGPFTVFAPTDAAFAKLPEGTLEQLLADKAKLTQVLTYHVVPGKIDSSAVSGIAKLATVEGTELAISDIAIAKTDIAASNGVIHVIDEVLIP